MMGKKLNLTALILLALFLTAFPAQSLVAGDLIPERIILNPTQDPAHQQAITWRSSAKLEHPLVQLAPARPGVDLEDHSREIETQAERVELADGQEAWSYSAIINGLDPETLYYYRVGSEENWSEWISFTTAATEFKPFRFVYFGDPQVGLQSYCPRIFRQALRAAPDALFWLFGGDQVNRGNSDEEFLDFFQAGGWMFKCINIIPTVGNHEYPRITGQDERRLTPLWRPHYTLPENGPEGLEETSYWIDYQGLKLIVLNNNQQVAEQRDWLEGILRNNTAKWTILSMHQPIYSTGSDRDNPELQELYLPLIDKYGVDLVLQGHDHTYGRTYPLRNNKIAVAGENGTIFVVSSSGSKFYRQNPRYLHLMAKTALDTQLFQVIEVEEEALHYRAETATGSIIDQFTIRKN